MLVCGLLIECAGGCATASLMRTGDPRAMVLLPFTLTFDALAFGISSALKRDQTRAAGPIYNTATDWHDPDDWVATCAGPLMCPEHRHFVCAGEIHACTCSCVVTMPEPAAQRQVALLAH
ncbi:MAG: hypothetical protein DRI90_19810 [Deltaproteobacteria bacterium]|nr:MAG: hypothetical protein DRI90_19810 [Deltaproteobacteria bacterium]